MKLKTFYVLIKVIQRRIDGSVFFNRNWNSYKEGFGEVEGEYWLGITRICDKFQMMFNTVNCICLFYEIFRMNTNIHLGNNETFP